MYVTLKVREILTVCEVEVFPIKGSAVQKISALTGEYMIKSFCIVITHNMLLLQCRDDCIGFSL